MQQFVRLVRAIKQALCFVTALLEIKRHFSASYSIHSFMKMGRRQRTVKDFAGTLQLPQKSKQHTTQTCKSLGPKQLVTDTKTPNSIPDETTKLTNF
jgi:hypothetical protein